MGITARQLNRATLDRQMLLGRGTLAAPEAVNRLVALQGQEPSTPYLALWNRLVDFRPDDLDAAFADRTVVRSPSVRLTLHAVHADDWPIVYSALARSLRASRLGDRRFLSSGLSAERVDALIPDLVRFLTRPRGGAEIEQMIDQWLGGPQPRAWWALRRYAPLHRAPTGGPWSFDGSSFVAASTVLAPEQEEESVRELLLRYLRAFGPASPQDFAQFTILRRPAVQKALSALGDAVEAVAGPGGAKLFDVAGASVPDEDTPAPPRLLPMWDSTLLAYADRARVLPPAYRAQVIRRNGDVLPTLLVDGCVAGVWRPVPGGIEATAFQPLAKDAWNDLAAEAVGLAALLADRDPEVYRRYGHWWDKGMPGAEVRVLPG